MAATDSTTQIVATAIVSEIASAQVELLRPATSQPPSARFHPSVGLPEQSVSYRPCPPWPSGSKTDPAVTATRPLLTVTIPPASVPLIFAHRQWRAGLILADLIAAASHSSPFNVQGRSVLELGCGTAIPGMVAAKVGQSSRSLVTDYASPPLIGTLTSNVRSNFTPEHIKALIRPAGFTWGSSTEDLEDIVDALAREQRRAGETPQTSYRWDRILLADCLWDPLSHADLLASITKLLEKPDGRVLVVSGLHTGREKLVNFIRRARRSGLALVDVGAGFPSLDAEQQVVAQAEQASMTLDDALYYAPQFVYELELASDDDDEQDPTAACIDTGSQPRLTGRRRTFVIEEREEERKELGGVHVRNRWITVWGLGWAGN